MTKRKFKFTVSFASNSNLRASERRTLITTQKHHDFLAANKFALDFAMSSSGPTERIVSLAVEHAD